MTTLDLLKIAKNAAERGKQAMDCSSRCSDWVVHGFCGHQKTMDADIFIHELDEAIKGEGAKPL